MRHDRSMTVPALAHREKRLRNEPKWLGSATSPLTTPKASACRDLQSKHYKSDYEKPHCTHCRDLRGKRTGR